MRQLPLDHLRHAALLQHQEHVARLFRQRSAVDIDELRAGEARRRDLDAVLVDRRTRGLHLLDEAEQRTAEGDDLRNAAAHQSPSAHRVERLRGGIREYDRLIVGDDEDRMRQRAQQTFAVDDTGGRPRRLTAAKSRPLRGDVALLLMPPRAPH